jgi:hypothetical protein
MTSGKAQHLAVGAGLALRSYHRRLGGLPFPSARSDYQMVPRLDFASLLGRFHFEREALYTGPSQAFRGQAQAGRLRSERRCRRFDQATSTIGRNDMLRLFNPGCVRIMGAPKLTVRVDLGSGRALGPGKTRLLEAIEETGSLECPTGGRGCWSMT